jgi:hypothetical protein
LILSQSLKPDNSSLQAGHSHPCGNILILPAVRKPDMSSETKVQNNTSHHILPTSANLLGLCFLLLTSINLFGYQTKTYLDEMVGIAILFFLGSSLFSYASIRSSKSAALYEKIADIVFLVGLAFLSLVAFVLVANIM